MVRSPQSGVRDANRVATARAAAVKTVLVHGRPQRHGDVGRTIAGLGNGQTVFDAFQQGRFGADEVGGRRAEEHGARHGRMVALEHPGNFEEGAFTIAERRIVPGQVWRRRIACP